MTDQEWCDRRNAMMVRTDIEWAIGPTGIYLRDKDWYTADHAQALGRKAEAERQKWLHRHRFPERYI
jgi:hypothetical protein